MGGGERLSLPILWLFARAQCNVTTSIGYIRQLLRRLTEHSARLCRFTVINEIHLRANTLVVTIAYVLLAA